MDRDDHAISDLVANVIEQDAGGRRERQATSLRVHRCRSVQNADLPGFSKETFRFAAVIANGTTWKATRVVSAVNRQVGAPVQTATPFIAARITKTNCWKPLKEN